MGYGALTVGMADGLLSHLQDRFASHDLYFQAVPTVQEASRQLSKKMFHLLIADLEYLRSIEQIAWLGSVRQITFAPLIVLSDNPEQDSGGMVELGADICVSGKQSQSMVADMVFAQLRRYTEYNHYDDPRVGEASSFTLGNISIDPSRQTVKIRGRDVILRPREFDLLLLFMRNPDHVFSAEEICERAWSMEGGYNRGVSQPIYLLRKAIEPDPNNPIYIRTVYRRGYRFTPNHVATCDECESFVSVL